MNARHTIETRGLGKRYQLGEGGSYQTLREMLASLVRGRRPQSARGPEMIWALRDLDLTIDDGEAVGLIGRNGAGKTTLLKILARITEPTTGVARVRGRVGALLEVGTGFHPELTGRENVFLNGAVLGMSRSDTRRRFDDIVAFAGVERFLDTPLKRYSAGMYLRLAFSVAAHLEPDVVVVDEVLAVGDTEFQQKCLMKMSEFGSEGRTVVFVSHDLGAVARLCPRMVWLDKGQIAADGESQAVVDAYLKSGIGAGAKVDFAPDGAKPAQMLSVLVTDASGRPASALPRTEPFEIALRFSVIERIPGLDVSAYLINSRGVHVFHEGWADHASLGESIGAPGEYEAVLTVPAVLPAGEYTLGVWIGTEVEDLFWEEPLRFRLQPTSHDREEAIRRSRVIQLSSPWRVSPRLHPGE